MIKLYSLYSACTLHNLVVGRLQPMTEIVIVIEGRRKVLIRITKSDDLHKGEEGEKLTASV